MSGRGAPRGRGGGGGMHGSSSSTPSTRGGGATGAGAVGAPRGPKAQPPGRNGKSTPAAAIPLTPEEEAKRKEKEKALEAEARKRTITDFRIIGLEIKALNWSWGQVKEGLDADDYEEQHQLLDDDDEEELEEEKEEELKHKQRQERKRADGEGVKAEEAAAAVGKTDAEEDSYEVFDVVAGESVKTEAVNSQETADARPAAEEEQPAEAVVIVKEEKEKDEASESEEKRGAKRKAKMSSPEPGSCRDLGVWLDSVFSFSFFFASSFLLLDSCFDDFCSSFNDFLRQMTTSVSCPRSVRLARTEPLCMRLP